MLASTPFTIALKDLLGGRFRVHPRECERFAVAGATPKLVLSPQSIEEAARSVKIIAQERASVVIRGGGTKSLRPPALRDLDAVLDTSELRGMLDHKPGDLTARVAGGTPLSELQFSLRKHGQFFPCDAPFAANATLGGALAANSNGALRQRYGGLRDNVLGMRVALSDGLVAFSGANVVKSVAGYDVHKAFIGSYGTLGVIGEVVLKVAPMPATERLLVAGFRSLASACAAATAIARSNLFVMATTLHDPKAAQRAAALRGSSEWTLVVRCGGSRAATTAQFDGAAATCKSGGASAMRDLDAELVPAAWADIAELAGGAMYPSERYAVAKLVGLPAQTHLLADAAHAAWPDAELCAHPSAGVLFANIPIESAQSQPGELWKQLAAHDWSASYIAAPPALADAWIAPLPAHSPMKLQRRLKAALDKAGIFDPGRYWGGI
jgi:glycolate oxidase FAD binding subunit